MTIYHGSWLFVMKISFTLQNVWLLNEWNQSRLQFAYLDINQKQNQNKKWAGHSVSFRPYFHSVWRSVNLKWPKNKALFGRMYMTYASVMTLVAWISYLILSLLSRPFYRFLCGTFFTLSFMFSFLFFFQFMLCLIFSLYFLPLRRVGVSFVSWTS